MRTPQRLRPGYTAMNAIAPRHDFARGHAIATPRDAPIRSGFLRCIVDTIVRVAGIGRSASSRVCSIGTAGT